MGLIIKNKIAQLKKGYPTVSDKYNVQGGINESDVLHFGDLVTYGTATGHYKKMAAATDKLAGIVLATNVKLANRYPGDSNASVETLKGEAFNLLVRGFVAVKVDSSAYKTAYDAYVAAPNATTKAALDNAKDAEIAKYTEGTEAGLALVGTEVVFTDDTTNPVEGAYFMGVVEFVGDEVIAEINYRM